MKHWLAFFLLAVLLLPGSALSTGSLTTPNVIFTKPNPVPTSLLDQNWTAHANYINAREITFGLLGSRPTAGTAGRYYFATDTGAFFADNGTAWVQLSTAPLIAQRSSMTMANTTGSTQFFSVFPGAVTSDDALSVNRVMLESSSTISKKLTTWAVGTNLGCLDTGSAAVFTWYHVFVIQRVDTGVVDVLCSTSATAPTMPTNYTKKQRVGSILTTWFATAGAELYQFRQIKNKFRWATYTLDVNNATPGAGTSNVATLSIPNGLITEALIGCTGASTSQIYVSELNVTDAAPGAMTCAGQGATMGGQAVVTSDPAQRIRYLNNANVGTGIYTFGWYELWD